MTAIRKYGFDLDFDEAESPSKDRARAKKAKQEGPPPEPTFTRAELEAARDAAQRQGYEAGLAEGRTAAATEATSSLEARFAASMNAISTHLERLSTAYRDAFANLERDAVAVAHAIARKALPEVAQTHALEKLESLVRFCLSRIVEEPRVVFRVPDEILDSARVRIEEVGASVGFAGKMIFLTDDELGPGDCRIEWADGGAESETRRVWTEIDSVVDQYLKAIDARSGAPRTEHFPDESIVERTADSDEPNTVGET